MVTITFTVTDSFDAQIESMVCSLNCSDKDAYIRKLIHNDLAVFFKNRKEEELQKEINKNNSTLRKSWGLDSEVKNKNLITVGRSIVFPPAY